MRRYLVYAVLVVVLPFLGGAVTLKGNNIFRTYFNDTSTGTTQYFLAKVVPSAGQPEGKAIRAGTGDTGIPLGLVQSTQGNTGTASLVWTGEAPCAFDAANASGVAGQPVVASTTAAGKCHTQSSPPANGMVLGYMISDATTTTTVADNLPHVMFMNQPYIPGSSTAAGGTVNPGTDKALACYNGTGTTVDDCVQIGPANRYPKSNGTDFTLSTMGAGGVGTCTNQVVTANNADAVPTCTTVTSAYVNNTIALTGVDINTSNQVTGASGLFALKGDVTPGIITGGVDDYAGCDNQAVCNLEPSGADRTVGGFANGTDGRMLLLRNVSPTWSLILADQAGTSSGTNRLALTGTVTLPPGGTFALVYSTAASINRWLPWQNTILDAEAIRKCEIDNGSISSAAPPILLDDNILTTCSNDYRKPWKITGFACKVDQGTMLVRPILAGGSNTSIVTADVNCGTSWTSGTINGTPLLNPFAADGATCASPPCTADLTNVPPGTGNTAKRLQMKLIGSLQK